MRLAKPATIELNLQLHFSKDIITILFQMMNCECTPIEPLGQTTHELCLTPHNQNSLKCQAVRGY